MASSNTFLILFLAALLVPSYASAQVLISEIMYDLDGADSGYEWIEVYNSGDSSVVLTDWRFFEADTNHKINSIQGGDSLAAGSYAIIADNSAKFLQKNNYSGQLFDSAFSLSNSGENLGMRDSELVDRDSVTYSPDLGAAGDGNSLHRGDSGSFSAGAPTPGTGSLTVTTQVQSSNEEEEDTGESGGGQTLTPQNAPPGTFSVEPMIYAYAGDNQIVIVGADVAFTGRAFNAKGEPIDNVRYLWNFGDGATLEGESILHNWAHPGRYVLVLDIAQEKNAASDSVIITAEPANIKVDTWEDGSIVLTNNAGRTLDLSGWHLSMANSFFTLPKNSRLLNGEDVAFSPDVTGLTFIQHPSELWYPNGEVAVREGEGVVDVAIPASPVVPAPRASISNSGNSVIGRVVAEKNDLPEEAVEESEDENLLSFSSSTAFSDNQTASAASSGFSFGWGFGLLAFLGLASVAVIGIRRYSRASWEIIEE